jgi:hypothetical protein
MKVKHFWNGQQQKLDFAIVATKYDTFDTVQKKWVTSNKL